MKTKHRKYLVGSVNKSLKLAEIANRPSDEDMAHKTWGITDDGSQVVTYIFRLLRNLSR